jgi:hypothetical protein
MYRAHGLHQNRAKNSMLPVCNSNEMIGFWRALAMPNGEPMTVCFEQVHEPRKLGGKMCGVEEHDAHVHAAFVDRRFQRFDSCARLPTLKAQIGVEQIEGFFSARDDLVDCTSVVGPRKQWVFDVHGVDAQSSLKSCYRFGATEVEARSRFDASSKLNQPTRYQS